MAAEFTEMARQIMERSGLMIAGKLYEICEVEFYLHSEQHPDETVHCHPEQKSSGHWYFHRTSARDNAGYKGGTFKGLDMTFGDSEAYFGVLIRAIYSPETGIICGPCLVVNHILKEYKVESIAELVDATQMSISSNPHSLHVVSVDPWPQETMYQGPRIGLHGSWADRPYRYVRRYNLAKKEKRSLTPCLP
jgi:hypothetical protein